MSMHSQRKSLKQNSDLEFPVKKSNIIKRNKQSSRSIPSQKVVHENLATAAVVDTEQIELADIEDIDPAMLSPGRRSKRASNGLSGKTSSQQYTTQMEIEKYRETSHPNKMKKGFT
jgi:hypothetical protein